jgi:hypothetical protein
VAAANHAGIEINRTGKVIQLIAAEPAPDDKVSCNPILASWIIVRRDVAEVDVGGSEAIRSLVVNRLPADVHCLSFRHAPVASKIATTVVGPIIWRPETAVIAVIGSPIGTNGPVRTAAALKATRVCGSASPEQVERVAFGPAVGILYLDHRRTAVVARIANQCLPASAIHACEAKIRRVRRHRGGAFEAPPLGRLPVQVAQVGAIAADFDLSRAVDEYFHRALPA